MSALLTWCDARRFGGRLLLRLEDLDLARSRPAFAAGLQADLAWLGLDFDEVVRQSDAGPRHRAALARLAAAGRLYACTCSRAAGRPPRPSGPARGPTEPHACGASPVDGASWALTAAPLRLRLGDSAAAGDPHVRRRDGAVAYVLASVVDDAAQGVTHIVRGRDLEALQPIQAAIYRLLGAPLPRWRHHLLLRAGPARKLAKVHGDIACPQLAAALGPAALCGWLAHVAGLRATPAPTTPAELVEDFSWRRVRRRDQVVAWEPPALRWCR